MISHRLTHSVGQATTPPLFPSFNSGPTIPPWQLHLADHKRGDAGPALGGSQTLDESFQSSYIAEKKRLGLIPHLRNESKGAGIAIPPRLVLNGQPLPSSPSITEPAPMVLSQDSQLGQVPRVDGDQSPGDTGDLRALRAERGTEGWRLSVSRHFNGESTAPRPETAVQPLPPSSSPLMTDERVVPHHSQAVQAHRDLVHGQLSALQLSLEASSLEHARLSLKDPCSPPLSSLPAQLEHIRSTDPGAMPSVIRGEVVIRSGKSEGGVDLRFRAVQEAVARSAIKQEELLDDSTNQANALHKSTSVEPEQDNTKQSIVEEANMTEAVLGGYLKEGEGSGDHPTLERERRDSEGTFVTASDDAKTYVTASDDVKGRREGASKYILPRGAWASHKGKKRND